MTTLRVAIAAGVILLSASAAHAQKAAIGTWDLTTVSPEGEFKSEMEVRQEGDKLVMTISYNGSPMTITYVGKIDGPKIEGQTDYGGLATGTFSAAKK